MTLHQLEPTAGTTADVFSPEHQPVLTVDPGDTVMVRSLDAQGCLTRQTYPGERTPTMFAEFRGHCLTGPSRCAAPGPATCSRCGWSRCRPATGAGPARRAAWTPPSPGASGSGEARAPGCCGNWTQRGDGHAQDAAPEGRGTPGTWRRSSGSSGWRPPRPGSIPRSRRGRHAAGTSTARNWSAGTTLYLPVNVDGALLYLGDGHAAQGDGEVRRDGDRVPDDHAGPRRSRDRAAARVGPRARPSGQITFGFSRTSTRRWETRSTRWSRG